MQYFSYRLKTPERPRIFSDLLSPDSAEQSDNVKFLQRETELLLMPLAEKLIDQTVNEVRKLTVECSYLSQYAMGWMKQIFECFTANS